MRNINMHQVVVGLGYDPTDLDSIMSIDIDVNTGVVRIGRAPLDPNSNDTVTKALGPNAPLRIYDVFNFRAGYNEETREKPWLDPSVPVGRLPRISRATYDALCALQTAGVSHDIPHWVLKD